jgi:phosphinothricin acetyltransferase
MRFAAPDDAEQMLAIYAPYIRKTAISFEYEVPSLEEFRLPRL